MTSLELFDRIEEELTEEITGTITYDGEILKWEYDGINDLYTQDDFEAFLENIGEIDKDIIREYLEEIEVNNFNISDEEINDTFIYFYIEED